MNAAFIPVRGGSKSIPFKNIKPINGKPLVYWVLDAAQKSSNIDKIYVSTDNLTIKSTVESFKLSKIEVIERSMETATDTASTESAMLEFAEQYEFDNLVLIQATSPLLKTSDLDGGFELFFQKGTDSVLSVVRQKRFHWEMNQQGFVFPTNYDHLHRLRRQEYEGYLVENGAFYITSKLNLLNSKNRISGNIKAFEMEEDSFYEIDEPSDWEVVEYLMKRKQFNSLQDYSHIRLVATDCDGVLTDAGMYYTEQGDEIKKFNTLDGMGFELLRERGIKTAIITSEKTSLVARRGNKLKVDDIILGVKDKLKALEALCEKYQILMTEVVYIGDDIFDLPAIIACGLGCSPASANDNIKIKADYITNRRGGEGCFREIVDLILSE